MIEINETRISSLNYHRICNDDNRLFVSNYLYNFESEDEEILKKIFLKPFLASSVTYEFKHDIDLELNPLFKISQSIYNGEDFKTKSQQVYQHLKTSSKHPNIKDGDLFIVKYDDIKLNGAYYEALGIYKIENKENFIETNTDNDNNISLQFKKGIGGRKLDKACLILFSDEPYTIFIIDNGSIETDYWKNDFINVVYKNDFINNTNHFLALTKSFITNENAHQFEISKADQVDLLNKSVKFFKEKDNFELNEFANDVLGKPDMINSFNKYKSDYQKELAIEIADNFIISDLAVKKQARSIKSIIKLDKNFHIYVHGSRELIEQGVDEEGRKFYKIYYKEES